MQKILYQFLPQEIVDQKCGGYQDGTESEHYQHAFARLLYEINFFAKNDANKSLIDVIVEEEFEFGFLLCLDTRQKEIESYFALKGIPTCFAPKALLNSDMASCLQAVFKGSYDSNSFYYFKLRPLIHFYISCGISARTIFSLVYYSDYISLFDTFSLASYHTKAENKNKLLAIEILLESMLSSEDHSVLEEIFSTTLANLHTFQNTYKLIGLDPKYCENDAIILRLFLINGIIDIKKLNIEKSRKDFLIQNIMNEELIEDFHKKRKRLTPMVHWHAANYSSLFLTCASIEQFKEEYDKGGYTPLEIKRYEMTLPSESITANYRGIRIQPSLDSYHETQKAVAACEPFLSPKALKAIENLRQVNAFETTTNSEHGIRTRLKLKDSKHEAYREIKETFFIEYGESEEVMNRMRIRLLYALVHFLEEKIEKQKDKEEHLAQYDDILPLLYHAQYQLDPITIGSLAGKPNARLKLLSNILKSPEADTLARCMHLFNAIILLESKECFASLSAENQALLSEGLIASIIRITLRKPHQSYEQLQASLHETLTIIPEFFADQKTVEDFIATCKKKDYKNSYITLKSLKTIKLLNSAKVDPERPGVYYITLPDTKKDLPGQSCLLQ